jgi:predicted AlkP superfamily phosphohydrolase/phosphomutase
MPRPIHCLALHALLSLVLPAFGQAPVGRVVVLGFDGGDARTVEKLMAEGQLPNLSALAREGTFGHLMSTNPAESPVSWSSLNTGQNPAKTGIPGFVVRDLVGGDKPYPGIGFYESEGERPLERLANTPIPTWPADHFALIFGALTLLSTLVVFRLLMRLRLMPAALISVSLAACAAWAGWRLRSYLPQSAPVVANTLEAVPFWETAASAGVPSVVLDAAQAWDRADVPGTKVLAGLGVPDARGLYNGFTIYTSDPNWFATQRGRESSTPSAGDKLRVDWQDGRIESFVWGPLNFWRAGVLREQRDEIKAQAADPKTPYKKLADLVAREEALTAELERVMSEPITLPLLVERNGSDGVRLTMGDHDQALSVGRWSDWYPLTFDLNPLIKVHALARAKLVRLDEPHFTLYLDALQIDPARPPFWQPISQPHEFASELAAQVGPYETVGWACMNLPFKDAEIDAASFLEDIEFTFQWRRRMTLERLQRDDWRLFFSCFSTPDRLQHMCYQYYDQEHPLYDAERAAQTVSFFGQPTPLSQTIPAIYRQVDALVGDVRALLGPQDVLILCADHGFQSFRRQVHLNNWLLEKGYLSVKPKLSKSSAVMPDFYVDWSKTRAYSIGLGMVYVNLVGREKGGIVEPSDVPALLQSIARDFREYVDPATGQPIGRTAHASSEIHSGPFLDREADLLLGFEAGYRVSWITTSGGLDLTRDDAGAWVPAPSISDNDKNWSGDHVSVDPALVQGLFFSSVPLQVPEGGLDLRHVAPTTLSLLGVGVPTEYDLAPLERR